MVYKRGKITRLRHGRRVVAAVQGAADLGIGFGHIRPFGRRVSQIAGVSPRRRLTQKGVPALRIIPLMAGFPATVLICDDEPFLRELIRVSLNGDYEFAEAADGIECLEMARRVRPDVVILDVLMPLRSGLEVLEAFRQDELLADTAVIVLTAQPEMRDDALRGGARVVIDKPFIPDQISAAVEEVLAGQK